METTAAPPRCTYLDCPQEARYQDRCLPHLRPTRKNWYVRIPADEMTFGDVFWLSVRTGQPDVCWPWLGSVSQNGYGHLLVSGKATGAHRVALELATGPIPDGAYACHRYDNPPCCNPAHLFAGTHLENDKDRKEKGRGVHGVRHPSHKLMEGYVQSIRRALSQGVWGADLAAHFGVSVATVSAIGLGKIWAHVPDDPSASLEGLPLPRRLRTGEANGRAKLTKDDAANIRRRYLAGGVSQRQLAKEYGVHQTVISAIVRNKIWADAS